MSTIPRQSHARRRAVRRLRIVSRTLAQVVIGLLAATAGLFGQERPSTTHPPNSGVRGRASTLRNGGGEILPAVAVASTKSREASSSTLGKRAAALESSREAEAVAAGEATSSAEPSSSTPPRTTSRTSPMTAVREFDYPYTERLVEPEELEFPPWSLFEASTRFDEPPDGSFEKDNLPLFHMPPPEQSDFARAVERVAHRKLFSEVRRFFKRNWKKQFLATPTMHYSRYIEGISNINQIGRDPEDFEFINTQHFSNQFKDDLFQRPDRQGEEDFEMFGWGPLVVMDSGSVKFDMGRALHTLGFDSEPSHKHNRTESLEPGTKPVLASKEYRVSTSLKLGFDPLEAMKTNDMTWVVDRYGVGVEVSWYSDVLGREMLTSEFEVEFERNGEFAAIVNFIFRSRN